MALAENLIDCMGVAELLDERRALQSIAPRMQRSITRGADWMIGQFSPGGPIMGKRDLSYCHKVAWGLYEAGRTDAAVRVLDWVSENARVGPARYYFPEEPPFSREMQLLYRLLTFGRVAECLNHPGIANQETREEILTYQLPCGGASANKDLPDYSRSLNPLLASFFSEWAFAAGMEGPARKAADFLAMLVERNLGHMQGERGRFYFNYDPETGDLRTVPEDGEEINCFVDTVKPKQQFYQVGTAMAGLASAHGRTGDESYLNAALALAEFERRLNPTSLKWPSYCKIGWGAAELYALTGSPRHRRAAANVSEITFISSQTDAGGWSEMYYPLKDGGEWETAVYDGSARTTRPRQDGSWACLSAYEITGEFVAEMSRTLFAFSQARQRIDERLKDVGH